MPNSLQPHGLQHARPPCPSPTPEASSNSCPSSQWCHSTISSFLIPPSIFPCIRVFPNKSVLRVRWPKYWELQLQHQSFQWIFRISFRTDWFDLLAVQGTLKSLLTTTQFKIINSSALSFLYGPTLTSIHDYWKNHSFDKITFVSKVMSLLFNMLSRLIIAFLPRSKHLLLSWVQSPSAVILEPPKIKSVSISTVSPSICHEVMGPDAMIWVFRMLSFKPAFHSPLSLSTGGSSVPLHFLP